MNFVLFLKLYPHMVHSTALSGTVSEQEGQTFCGAVESDCCDEACISAVRSYDPARGSVSGGTMAG